jgi:aryl-alcohol dehydrogenase-like predicted oxidoreductase
VAAPDARRSCANCRTRCAGYDPHTPVDELLRTLDDLVTAGTVRYIGFSDTPAWFTAQAHTIATLRGWAPVVALQMEYSLLSRTIEGEIIPLAQDTGMAVLPWGPLKSGFLTGKYARDQPAPADAKWFACSGHAGRASSPWFGRQQTRCASTTGFPWRPRLVPCALVCGVCSGGES